MGTTLIVPTKRIEKGFSIFFLIVFSDPTSLYKFILGLFGNGNDFRLRSTLVLLVGLISALLLGLRWRQNLHSLLRSKWLWLLVGVAFFSFFWSENAKLTIRTAWNLILTTLTGVYFGTRFNSKEQVRLVAYALIISGILCLIFAVAIPTYGLMGNIVDLSGQQETHRGVWQGIYTHKNFLGRIMSLGGLTCLLAALDDGVRKKWLFWLGFILTSSIVCISSSKTSLLALLFILFLLPFYQALRWSIRSIIPFGIITIIVLGSFMILIGSNADSLLGTFLNRDLTFTGRTELWAAVVDQIFQHPWFGYGYKAFWTGWLGPANAIWVQFKWLPAHAHNGLLQLFLDLGIVGVTIFTFGFFTLFRDSINFVRLTKGKEQLFPVIFLTFLFFINLTETVLLDQSIYWLLYASVTVTVSKYLTMSSMHSGSWRISISKVSKLATP